jgi:uncharacterized protein (TIGR02300 family)
MPGTVPEPVLIDIPRRVVYFARAQVQEGHPAMARDLGTKYVCYKCGTKFYDLKKPVPACPKCGADQREAPVMKPTSTRASRAAAPAKEPEAAEVPADDEEKEEAEDDEDEED